VILNPCRDDPGAGNIVTFAQFLFIALEGLVFTSNFLQKKAVVPLRYNLCTKWLLVWYKPDSACRARDYLGKGIGSG